MAGSDNEPLQEGSVEEVEDDVVVDRFENVNDFFIGLGQAAGVALSSASGGFTYGIQAKILCRVGCRGTAGGGKERCTVGGHKLEDLKGLVHGHGRLLAEVNATTLRLIIMDVFSQLVMSRDRQEKEDVEVSDWPSVEGIVKRAWQLAFVKHGKLVDPDLAKMKSVLMEEGVKFGNRFCSEPSDKKVNKCIDVMTQVETEVRLLKVMQNKPEWPLKRCWAWVKENPDPNPEPLPERRQVTENEKSTSKSTKKSRALDDSTAADVCKSP